jgi:hypothetical protein
MTVCFGCEQRINNITEKHHQEEINKAGKKKSADKDEFKKHFFRLSEAQTMRRTQRTVMALKRKIRNAQ